MQIEQIAELVKSARIEAGLSMLGLAKLAGCSGPWISGFESGELSFVNARMMFNVCEILGVSIFNEPELKKPGTAIITKLVGEKFKKPLTKEMIANMMVYRRPPKRRSEHVKYLLQDMPPSVLIKAVKEISAEYQVDIKSIWENLSAIASYENVKTPFWLSIKH